MSPASVKLRIDLLRRTEKNVKATSEWLSTSELAYHPEPEQTGQAHLKYYTAQYAIWGEGPPLVLVPGLAGGYKLLGPLVRELSRSHRVLAYQLRGEDDPFVLRQRFGLSELVNDLEEILEWFGLERPTLMGVSFGGVLALELAIRSPYRLSSLILQGVGPQFEPSFLRQVASFVLRRYPLPVDSPFINQFFNLFFGSPVESGPLVDFVVRQCWQTDQGVMAHRFVLVEQLDFQDRPTRVRVPTLLLAGTRDLLVSSNALRKLTAQIPQARAFQLPGCGHLAFASHPQLVAEPVLRFLDVEDAQSRE